jgi:hypothetical protein
MAKIERELPVKSGNAQHKEGSEDRPKREAVRKRLLQGVRTVRGSGSHGHDEKLGRIRAAGSA